MIRRRDGKNMWRNTPRRLIKAAARATSPPARTPTILILTRRKPIAVKNMDRTSWIGVIVCLALLFTWGWWSTKEAAKLAAQREVEKAKAAAVAKSEKGSPAAAEKGAAPTAAATAAPLPAGAPKAETAVLENDYLRIHLTSEGAGIQRAEMKKHPRQLGQSSLIAINETASHPVGALSAGPKEYDNTIWTVAAKNASEVAYETTTPDGLKWRKTIRLPARTPIPTRSA